MAESLLHRSRAVNEDSTERAQRAVAVFRALQPTLTAYARMMTRRQDVYVKMSASDNGSTDGKVINYRPPMSLGDNKVHSRKLCDKRDENLQQLCPACGAREECLITIYHEIGHICEDSNRPVTDNDKREMTRDWLRNSPAPYASRVRAKLETLWMPGNYLELAGTINPSLAHMVNCLEDARVNRGMVSARPGLRVMFEADSWRIFNQGFEARHPQTGEIVTVDWRSNPMESQLMVGLYLMGSEYDYSTWLHPDAVAVLADPELNTIVKRIKTARSVRATFDVAVACLARFIELGYFRTPEDEKDLEDEGDESEEQPDEQESDGDSDSDESESGGDSGPSSPGEGEAEAETPDDSSSDTGGPNESENATEPGEGAGADDAPDDSPEADESSESDTSESGASSSSEPGDEAGDGADEDTDVSGSSGGESGDDVRDEQPGDDSESESDDGSDASGNGSVPTGPDDEPAPQPEEGAGLGGNDEEGEAEDGSGQADSVGDGVQPEGADEAGEGEAAAPAGGEDQGAAGEHESGEQDHADHSTSDDEGPGSPEVDEPIDTGADDGTGGIEVLESGTPEEAAEALESWLGHTIEGHEPQPGDTPEDQVAIDRAIIQGSYFETPSSVIYGVREHFWGKPIIFDGIDMSTAWSHSHIKHFRKRLGMTLTNKALGIDGDFDPDETLISGALMHTRIAFAENKRGHYERGRKSGKVNTKVLGKRAPVGDPHLFKKKIKPGKKSYFVVIGVDISFSQVGENIVLTKAAAMAQAELLHRAGVPFAMYAHTGNYQNPGDSKEGLSLDIYHLKDPNEPWTEVCRERLRRISPASANLDGHTLEFYRKRLDEQQATDKIIMYYTDGKMPAENHDEELVILQREIALCKRRRYTLMGVGIRTDSPVRHGLDTVQLDDVADTVKVVKHLEKRLLADD